MRIDRPKQNEILSFTACSVSAIPAESVKTLATANEQETLIPEKPHAKKIKLESPE